MRKKDNRADWPKNVPVYDSRTGEYKSYAIEWFDDIPDRHNIHSISDDGPEFIYSGTKLEFAVDGNNDTIYYTYKVNSDGKWYMSEQTVYK